MRYEHIRTLRQPISVTLRGDDDDEDEKSKNKLQIKDANCRSRLMASIRAALCSSADKLLFPCLHFLLFCASRELWSKKKDKNLLNFNYNRHKTSFSITSSTTFSLDCCDFILFLLLALVLLALWMCR